MPAPLLRRASGVMGAIGFAAAKATDPGAGAADSLEAQQPILVAKALLGAPTNRSCPHAALCERTISITAREGNSGCERLAVRKF